MKHSERVVMTGVGLVLAAMALDYLGSAYGLLTVLVASFAIAIGGAIVSIRGLVEFFSERV